MTEEYSRNVVEQISDTIVFLNENKVNIEDEVDHLHDSIKDLEEKLTKCNNLLFDSIKKSESSADLFSPFKSNEKKDNENILSEKKNIYLNQITELKEKLNLLLDKKENLKSSIDYLNILVDYSIKYTHVSDFVNTVNTNVVFSHAIHGIKVLETQENERKRIARELHDSTVQNMTNVLHKTELCTRLIDIDPIRAKLELQTMNKSIKTTINDMRSIIYNLRPMSIDDLGLVATIEKFINEVRNNNEVSIILNVKKEEKDVLSIINLTLFRIIQEATNNAIKHGHSKKIVIDLEYNEDSVLLTIKDNGSGFNIEETAEAAKDENRSILSGFGLSIMKERVMLLSGDINIESNDKDGTIIFVKVPLRT